MEVLVPAGDPDRFFVQVAAAPMSALLLDYDGTLAPFHTEPRNARPYPGVQERVTAIARSGRTRVVFVTGRAVADLLPLLGMDFQPEVWGSHGWERRHADGRYEHPLLPASSVELLSAAAEIEACLPQGSHWEPKPYSVAVHWRGLAQDVVRRIERQTRACWEPLVANGTAAVITAFDGGLELRISGRTKANAVQTVAREMGASVPIAFLGDDFTDEDGFQALPQGGLGVLVRDMVRPTAASLWLRPPGELLEFLDRWRVAVTRDKGDSGRRDAP